MKIYGQGKKKEVQRKTIVKENILYLQKTAAVQKGTAAVSYAENTVPNAKPDDSYILPVKTPH